MSHSIFEGEMEVYEDPNRALHRVVEPPPPPPPPPPIGGLEALRHDPRMVEQLKALSEDVLAVAFLKELAKSNEGKEKIADAAAVGGLRGLVYSSLTGRKLTSTSTVRQQFAGMGAP